MVRQAKITSKGQVTIPLEIRTALKLQEGDTVTFELGDSDKVSLRPEREADPFAKWEGKLADGSGRNRQSIIKQLREERGW